MICREEDLESWDVDDECDVSVSRLEVNNTDNDTSSIASANNRVFDNLSIDTSSMDINVSIGTHYASESTLDLQEMTQSILDLEGVQATSSLGNELSSSECRAHNQVPLSPPPSYENVLEERKLAARASATAHMELDADSDKSPQEERVNKGIKIMHKSHKEFYRAVAKQWGITCKMSDNCRCIDCQSMYFDCEYDQNEQEKTDGGLGAGTPMFLSEVMHGSACAIL